MFFMQDFIAFLSSIPQSTIPWIGAAGLGLIFLGAKSQSSIIRTLTIGSGVFCFIFSFLWMLQWFNVFENIGAAILS
jgi:hypothetical protein